MSDHFVIIRVATARRGVIPPDDWLAYRLDLFRDFPAASLNAQSCTRFSVLLLIHERLHDRWATEFRGPLQVPSETLPVGDHWKETVSDRLLQRRSPSVITTTLDSDDAVSTDFIEQVQSRIRPDRGLNFLDGAQLHLHDGGLVSRRKYSNPFLSLHSTSGDWVLRDGGHKKLAARVPVDDVATSPMWLQVVHGGNVMNEFSRSATPLPAASLRNRFVLPAGAVWGRTAYGRAWIMHRWRMFPHDRIARWMGQLRAG